jgi:hypothetical protein
MTRLLPAPRPPRARRLLLAFAAAASASACKPPLHLQYDFGRAYVETLRLQADRTRPSAAHEAYQIYGLEGIGIRQNVQLESGDAESGEATVQQ